MCTLEIRIVLHLVLHKFGGYTCIRWMCTYYLQFVSNCEVCCLKMHKDLVLCSILLKYLKYDTTLVQV